MLTKDNKQWAIETAMNFVANTDRDILSADTRVEEIYNWILTKIDDDKKIEEKEDE